MAARNGGGSLRQLSGLGILHTHGSIFPNFNYEHVARNQMQHANTNANTESSQSSAWCGVYLPLEIQLMILDHLIRIRQTRLKQTLAPYAAVCRAWQRHIEPVTFSRLILSRFKLAQFDAITKHRQGLVRYVYLSIRLEPTFDDAQNYQLIRGYITALFRVLALWEPTKAGLTLDLSIACIGDTALHSRYFSDVLLYGPERYPAYVYDPFTPENSLNPGFSDDPHQHHLLSFALFLAKDSAYWLGPAIPKAPAVTRLLLRRQTRCHSANVVWDALLNTEKLPGLKELYYEQWRVITLLPRHLKGLDRVNFFRDDIHDYNYASRVDHTTRQLNNVHFLPMDPVRMIAEVSLHAQHVSGHWGMGALDFFAGVATEPSWVWDRLVTLALVFDQLNVWLQSPEALERITSVLASAAQAAQRMPQLETMLLWHSSHSHLELGDRPGFAGFFRYRAPPKSRSSSGRATVTLAATETWPSLPESVTDAWSTVAAAQRRRNADSLGYLAVEQQQPDLVVERLHLPSKLPDGTDVKYAADGIWLVQCFNQGTGIELVRPMSLLQMRREARFTPIIY